MDFIDIDIEIVGEVLEFVTPYYEMVQPFLLDTAVGLVLGIAFLVGVFRGWRGTLMSLLVQWCCLLVGFLAARVAAPRVADILLGIDAISGVFEEMVPIEILNQIAVSILTLFIAIFVYALVGSILFAFARNRQWHKWLLPKRELPNAVGRGLSGIFSLLHAYTYVFFFLAFMSLPFFNIIEEGSLAAMAVDANFVGAPLVEDMAQPLVQLQETIEVIENELDDIVDGGSIKYDEVARIINEDPERMEEIKESLQQAFPDVPEEVIANLEDFVQQEGVTPEEVREFFLTHMGQLIP